MNSISVSFLTNSFSTAGSRSNSPCSKYSYATYGTPYSQVDGKESHLPVLSPPTSGKGAARRYSATGSASNSRDTSPQRVSRLRSRSVTQTPQVVIPHGSNNSTARLLLQSREAETALSEALRREISDMDYGNHSDSEDSYTSNRSFLSETFSPSISSRQVFSEVREWKLLLV